MKLTICVVIALALAIAAAVVGLALHLERVHVSLVAIIPLVAAVRFRKDDSFFIVAFAASAGTQYALGIGLGTFFAIFCLVFTLIGLANGKAERYLPSWGSVAAHAAASLCAMSIGYMAVTSCINRL